MTLKDIEKVLRDAFPSMDLELRADGLRGRDAGFVREAAGSAGTVANPGAWTHYSYALHDTLEAGGLPKVKVHLSNVHASEEWCRRSVVSQAAVRYVLVRGDQ